MITFETQDALDPLVSSDTTPLKEVKSGVFEKNIVFFFWRCYMRRHRSGTRGFTRSAMRSHRFNAPRVSRGGIRL